MDYHFRAGVAVFFYHDDPGSLFGIVHKRLERYQTFYHKIYQLPISAITSDMAIIAPAMIRNPASLFIISYWGRPAHKNVLGPGSPLARISGKALT